MALTPPEQTLTLWDAILSQAREHGPKLALAQPASVVESLQDVVVAQRLATVQGDALPFTDFVCVALLEVIRCAPSLPASKALKRARLLIPPCRNRADLLKGDSSEAIQLVVRYQCPVPVTVHRPRPSLAALTERTWPAHRPWWTWPYRCRPRP